MTTTAVNNKLAHALGVSRSMYANLKAQKVADDVIKQVQKADAKKWGMKLDEWVKLINEKPASSQSLQITEKKESYREELDRLTNNLLAKLNGTTDEALAQARDELVKMMGAFREYVPIKQTDREDFRVLLSISTLANNPDQLAIYRGGWGDGSKVDRNQYSNGRLVPHAKSTGYKLEQPAPEFIDNAGNTEQSGEQEQPEQPEKTS